MPGSSGAGSAAFRPLGGPSALDTAAEPGAERDVVLLEAVGLSTGRGTSWVSVASPASAASSADPTSTSGPGRRAAQAVGRGIDLRVRAGRVLAITGPNGVGKTTLGLTFAGLLPPVAGTLRATDALTRGAGPAPHAWSSRVLAARIGTVFQDPEHQIVARTVRDEVLAGPRALGHQDTADTADGLEALLTTFGLAHLADVDPFTLSGGEQRRLAIASAIATRPPVLVLDEPTSGQDRATWEAVVQRLGALADEGTAVVVVTHDRDLVRALDADEVVLGPDGIVPLLSAGGDVAVLAPVRRPDVAGLVMSAGAILPLGRDPEQEAPTVPEGRAVSAGRAAPPGRSATRGVDGVQPVASLLGVLALGVLLVLSLDVVSAAVALAIEVVLLPLLRIPVRTLLVRTSPVLVAAPLTAVSIALYGSPSGREWFDLGFAHVTDGSLTLALATALRVLAVGVPALALFVRVDPTDLADGLAQVLRLPARFVLGALAAIRMTTLLVDDWRQLAMARRARGLADSGRLRRAASMAFSLLVLALRRATTLAVAMESRGFGAPGPRTWARPARFSWPEWAMVGVLVGIGVASIAVAVVAGTWRG
ncbi:ATP-binding cassette domain-containing protein [Curtobacterium sp. MCLR17_036]|uniref:ATP-binding cassette domain-containing protein n=1 Tax=Curtobacterium sp. MCLR17_036 TaxID=2175620 RepID=UPI0024DF8DCF|nr:ATP-binding cassette domain-containing protein [Curtobacterium sp. MCLR17_036]WIE66579.1 ATP-binding cassette domain-containing protein [Curtobacterium sp. MCLR17_036]